MDGLFAGDFSFEALLGNGSVPGGPIAFLSGGLFFILAVWVLLRHREKSRKTEETDRIGELSETVAALLDHQRELSGRLAQMTDQQARSSAELDRAVNERLDGMTKRLGDGLQSQTEKNHESLSKLQERLAVIDRAQRNLTRLSTQMVGLQDILSNKQARGAFGEIQLNDLVIAALPPSAYRFQTTLSSGKRADCLLNLPNPPGTIVIDAKFPLESYLNLRDAKDETPRARAARAFSADVRKHVRDIAERYIIPGETAESALMFLPSEAVYAELHAHFRDVVEESFKRRVWIVSPTTLMATLNTVRAVLKDAKIREQAGVVQAEVGRLLEDAGRLGKRVGNLESHFNKAVKDIREIRTSADNVMKRGARIDDLQLTDESSAEDLEPTRLDRRRLSGLG